MDILHPAISHENEPLCSAKMCCTHSIQCSSLVIFSFLFCFLLLLLHGLCWLWASPGMWSTSCPSASTQGPGITPTPLPSQGLHSLQLECVCCWSRLLGDCVGESGSVPGLVVQAGGYFPPHMWLQLRKRKGPRSRGPLWLPALFEIPPSRCYSNWTHFQLLKERGKWGANLPAAPLQSFFKWSTIRLNICFTVSLLIKDLYRKKKTKPNPSTSESLKS